jgi:DNA helicase-2/ATP-dependent DNA helicase PcrA
MTRAKEVLYLCRASVREFRGSRFDTVPSMFLKELPQDAIEVIDQSSGVQPAVDMWRLGGGSAAQQGWTDAGLRLKPDPLGPPVPDGAGTRAFVVGMLVRHPNYGKGRIVDVSGQGALRRVKVRFASAGEQTFIADKVTLEIIGKS